MILAGDIGGTSTWLALFTGGGREPAALEIYTSREDDGLDDMTALFGAARAAAEGSR